MGLYYLCSENKGADQLRGYRKADLRLCFRICKKACFLMTQLIKKKGNLPIGEKIIKHQRLVVGNKNLAASKACVPSKNAQSLY